jgi:hypothetical protein
MILPSVSPPQYLPHFSANMLQLSTCNLSVCASCCLQALLLLPSAAKQLAVLAADIRPNFVGLRGLQEMRLVVPNAQHINRGGLVLSELVETCRSHDFTDIIVLHEHRWAAAAGG